MSPGTIHDLIWCMLTSQISMYKVGPVNSDTVWKYISMPTQDRTLPIERAMDIEASRIVAWEFEDYDE